MIDINKYNKEFLDSISNDSEKILKEINSSKGYILELCKKNNVLIDKKLLIDNLNKYNINYIINNYTLTTEEKEKLVLFVNEKEIFETESKDIEKILTNHWVWPKNYILKKEDIEKYKKLLINYQNLDDDNFYNSLKASFSKIDLSEIQKMDLNWSEFYYYLPNDFHDFKDGHYTEFYLNILNKNEDYRHHFYEFYPFKESDKELLWKIIKNKDLKYKDFSNLINATSLINKVEFFNNQKAMDFSYFSLDEIEQNRSIIESKIKSHLESFSYLNSLVYECNDFTLFKQVYTKDFISNLIEIINKKRKWYGSYSNAFTYYDKDSMKDEYISHLLNETLNILLEKNSKDNFLIEDIVNIFSYFEDVYNIPSDIKINIDSKIESLLNNIDDYLNENLVRFTNIKEREFNNKIINFIINKKEHNSINCLLLLNEKNSKLFNHIISNNIKIDDEIFDLSIKMINNICSEKDWDLISKVKEQENNILFYSKENIDNIEENITPIIYRYNKNYKKDILIYGNIFNKPLILDLLGKMYDGLNNDGLNNEDLDFLTQYLKKFKNNIFSDECLLSFIYKSKYQNIVFPYYNQSEQEKIFNEFIDFKFKEDYINDIINKHDIKYEYGKKLSRKDWGEETIDIVTFDETQKVDIESLTDKQLTIYLSDLREKNSYYRNLNSKLENQLVYSFINNQLKANLKENDYSIFYLINKDLNYKKNDIFQEHLLTLDFNQLLKNFEDPYFIKTIEDLMSDYNFDKYNIVFPCLDSHEYEQLYNKFKTNITSKNESINDLKYLSFFSQNKSFYKEKLINEIPGNIYDGKLTIVAYDIEKDYVLLSPKEVNKSFENIINTNNFFKEGSSFNLLDFMNIYLTPYFAKEKNQKTLIEYFNNIANYFKENNSILYFTLMSSDVIGNIYNISNNFQSRHNKFIELVDWDICLDGLSKLLDYNNKQNEPQEGIYKIIKNFSYHTHYDKMKDSANKDYTSIYYSNIGDEKTLQLINLILDKCPTFLFGFHALGAAKNNIPEYFKKNIDILIKDNDKINEFLYPPKSHLFKDATSFYERINNTIYSYLEIMFELLDKRQDLQAINYLSFIFNNEQFLNNNTFGINKERNHIFERLEEDNRFINLLNIYKSKLKIEELVSDNHNKIQKRIKI